MKGHLSILFALLLVLSVSVMNVTTARADEDGGPTIGALCDDGHGGTGSTNDTPPNGDMEGDPENWLGGQNSVVPPKAPEAPTVPVITWFKTVLVRLLSFAR